MGELGNAGAICASASATEVKEVEESDVWMKQGDESEAKGVMG